MYFYSIEQKGQGTPPTAPLANCGNFNIHGPSPVYSNNGHTYIASGGDFSETPVFTWYIPGGNGGIIASGQGTLSIVINFNNFVNGGYVNVQTMIPNSGVGCSTNFYVIPL